MQTFIDTFRSIQDQVFNRQITKAFPNDQYDQNQVHQAIQQLAEINGEALASTVIEQIRNSLNSKIDKEHLSYLQKGQIDDSMHPDDNHGLFTEAALNSFFEYMKNSSDPQNMQMLASQLMHILYEELKIQTSSRFDQDYFPIYFDRPVQDAINILEINPARKAYEKLEIFDYKSFVDADIDMRQQIFDEAQTAVDRDDKSTVQDTFSHLLNLVRQNDITVKGAVEVVLNLQKVLRLYLAKVQDYVSDE